MAAAGSLTIKLLTLEDFKSWRGKHIVGPFMSFNCIIGTNGSGKSNVMDALGFVMGERVSSLRVKHTKDLIHGASIGRPVSNTARVTMVISSHDDGELNFCRSILGNSSVYHINNSPVTLAKYLEELQRIGIFTKTRNCLVFQGTVESIAMMNPKERTAIFERISLSGELAKEYERLKKDMLEAKEQTQVHLSKKRAAIHMKKQLSEQDVEAKTYQTLLDDLNNSNLQLMLFQLMCNKSHIEALDLTMTERQQVVNNNKSTLDDWEEQVKTTKSQHGRRNRELQQIDKDIRSEEKTLSLHQSQYTKTKINNSHHLKKVEEARSSLQEALRQRDKKQLELQQGRKEVAELERTWKSYEETFQRERAQDRDIELGEEQRYNQLKEMSRRQGAVDSQKADKLQSYVKSDQEKISFDQRRKKELEVTIKASYDQLEDLNKRAEKLEEYTETCKASLKEYCGQNVSLSGELQRSRQRNEEVNRELGEVLVELREAGDESHESRRQQQHKEVLESLRRLYPDAVFGRLVELCNPIHHRFKLAVTKVFGRYMNAIVVDTEKTARDCIKFIKIERAEAETFLPIDYLDVKPINERLREVAPNTKLVFDVVQCVSGPLASQLKRAVQFVCGNTLVCESLKEAQSVAFSGPERLKTVALDGTMFSKSGVISGGSSDLQNKAKRWDEKDMKQLKERKDQLTAELRELLKLRRKESALNQVNVKAQGCETRLKYSNIELDKLRKTKIPACQAERSRLESLLANMEAEVQMQQQNVERKEAELKSTRDTINQMEDTVFADFCAEIGIENIRQYEQEHLKEQAELDRKRLDFDGQISLLNAQLEYMQQQVQRHERKQKTLDETIAKEDRATDQQKEEETELLKAVEDNQNSLQELQNRMQVKTKEVSDAKSQLDENTKNLRGISRELVKLQKLQLATETSREQRYLARHNLLLDCKIQGVDITLRAGSFDDIADVQMDEESSVLGSAEIYLREEQLDIDFSVLPANLTIIEQEEEMDVELEKLRDTRSSMQLVLQKTNPPNLKAISKLGEVKSRFREARDALDECAGEARTATTEFNQVKTQRCELFNKCFEHVQNVIDPIYKRLCKNNSAQAFLSADNEDEPYLEGIDYNCVAPGKRSMDMENLSGGEKSIASLALLFALHHFRPAPFLVLDEVDAALDNTNIRKVTDFIRDESKDNMQIIVISLKEEFYHRSDALLGVCSDNFGDCIMSRMLSVDLRPYPLEDDDYGREEENVSIPPEADPTVTPSSRADLTVTPSSRADLTVTPSSRADLTVTPSSRADLTVTPSSWADLTATPSSGLLDC